MGMIGCVSFFHFTLIFNTVLITPTSQSHLVKETMSISTIVLILFTIQYSTCNVYHLFQIEIIIHINNKNLFNKQKYIKVKILVNIILMQQIEHGQMQKYIVKNIMMD